MSVFISKETISRLVKDIKQIIKSPLIENGIYYIHDDKDILKGYALIIGQADTPYFGGNYFFELNYPCDYPFSPPKVTYWTNGNNIRFNPNLYQCGKVCISLLNTWRGEQWTSCQTISTILLTLCTLLCSSPLLNEPGVTLQHRDVVIYDEIILFSNMNTAICAIQEKQPTIYVPFFDKFYVFVKENFLKNCDKLIEIAETKNKEYNLLPKQVNTSCYAMCVYIDYSNVIQRLNTIKQIFLHKDGEKT
jgi:ubiquitin-conjugating enzyme E2 Z